MPSAFDSLFAQPMAALAALHGETVQFKGREDSEPRDVATLQCRLDGEFAQQGFAGDGSIETLYVGVLKDETTGIPETIQVGDGHRLYYRGDVDRPFIWKGMKQNDRDDRWTLVFVRHAARATGGSPMSDGPLYTALTAMVAQLAECEPFAERIAEFGTTLPNDPSAHVYLDEAIASELAYSNTMNDLRPFVAIHEQGDGLQQVSQGVGVGQVSSGGQLILLFTDMSRPEGATANVSKLEFVRWVSSIIRWFSEHNGTGAAPFLTPWSSITQLDSYVRTEWKDREEKSQDFWTVTYAFAYGVPNA